MIFPRFSPFKITMKDSGKQFTAVLSCSWNPTRTHLFLVELLEDVYFDDDNIYKKGEIILLSDQLCDPVLHFSSVR